MKWIGVGQARDSIIQLFWEVIHFLLPPFDVANAKCWLYGNPWKTRSDSKAPSYFLYPGNIFPSFSPPWITATRRFKAVKKTSAHFKFLSSVVLSQQLQNICITFVQPRPNVLDVGPTLYKCYTNILCLLWSCYHNSKRSCYHNSKLPSVSPEHCNILHWWCSLLIF